MARFIVRRLIGMVIVLFVVSVLVFLIFNVIPNSPPAQRLAGKNATPTLVKSIEKEWGFDESLPQQYVTMMKKVFTGELIQYSPRVPVDDRIKEGIPATFSLSIGAGIIWLTFGLLLGYLAAIRAGGWLDRTLTGLAVAGISIPVFLLAPVLIYFLTYKLEIFPNGGYAGLTEDPWEWLQHMILPWFTLAVLSIGFYSRVLRSNMLDVMNEDYVRPARAQGLSERKGMPRHVLRTSLIPITTLFGLDFGATIAGTAIITEVLYNIEGIGLYAAESIGKLELPPIMGITLYGAFFVVFVNALVDITYAYLDPRVAPIPSFRDLRVAFATEGGLLQAVDRVNFDLAPGEVLAIVGESGSGKSVTAQTMIGLTRSKNSQIEGSVKLDGEELLDADDATMRRLRGEKIGMVFQDPMTSFNPVYRLGKQITEAIRAHDEDVGKEQARQRVIELFESVGIPNAERRIDDYPHEFSGGMRQRAMIAMALAMEPEVLIADEPTTALGVTNQAQILSLMKRLQEDFGSAIMIITHDLGVVAETADDILVMYAAKVVEEANVNELFGRPQHPYTWGLLGSL